MKEERVTLEQLGEIIAQAKTGRINRRNAQVFIGNPDKFNPDEPTKPQPLKTFILFEKTKKPSKREPALIKILATIQATDEHAAAAYFGGEYMSYPCSLEYAPSVYLPINLFKPAQPVPGKPPMIEFRKDGLYLCLDARCASCFIRIEEIPCVIEL